MELFEMLMSLIKQIRELHIEKRNAEDAKLKNRIKSWWNKLKVKLQSWKIKG
jgi:predicted CDP-diglyceride synthetase/phosphatidate cytidylyltransferase